MLITYSFVLVIRRQHGPGSITNDISRLVDEGAGQREVAFLEGVPDGGEIGGLVAGGPGLGPEDDVLELGAVRRLYCR